MLQNAQLYGGTARKREWKSEGKGSVMCQERNIREHCSFDVRWVVWRLLAA